MVPFSGWIKYLLRWALLIILFLQCLKRSQAPAFCKQLSLACTWKMYESDTRFYFFSPTQLATAEKEPWKHLTSVTNCWIQETKINKPLWHTVDVKNFSLHCTVLSWSWLTGLSTRGTTEPKPNSVCWSEFLKDFSAASTLEVLLPYIQHSLVPPCPLELRVEVAQVFCSLSSVLLRNITLMVAVLFKSKRNHKV